MSDHVMAERFASGAGELLLSVRRSGLHGEALKKAGDQKSHEYLMQQFRGHFPDDAVLSEEGADDPIRLGRNRVWIVDPLDGTREFSEVSRTDWAVHVALSAGGQVVAGAVALPGLGMTISTANRPAVVTPPNRRPRILVSRTRPTEHAHNLARHLDGELVPMGSAGAKAMAVVRGEADIYAHSGGQYEWDSAAPVAVAAAAGLHVSRLDGSPLRYNQPDPWLPDLLICRPDLSAAVIDLGLEHS
ncbi:3'(2'),5'-bisphosphate nucleotidase CysQ [Nocardia elegans]|uniref:3'(2'),5'-bisphosphate nucleotidase CysQ n=1 Tax=Nocardia elegans TaxID=300029 RepID=UPI002B4AED4E|nr:3'(2'),5'-bisphosphate nucleotidase CysQ [Nocardia elegans]